MARSSTPSFVLTLKMNTTVRQDQILNKRFFIGFQMYNKLVTHAEKRINALNCDKEYRLLLQERHTLVSSEKTDKKSVNKINHRLKDIRLAYGMSEYQFHAWISVQQNRYKEHIDSLTAQKIASKVWQAVDKYLFDNGKAVHYRRFDEFLSLEGKNNLSGIRFKKDHIEWNGLKIPVQIRKKDLYAQEALSHRVKYCRIVRKPVGTRYQYYVQLILEGIPPKKHEYLESGRVGIDPGVSTEAVVSENGCILTEIAPDRKNITRRVTKLQRKMDRSRRTSNPDNYNPDGTIVTCPHKFKKSKTYRRDQMRLASLRRRNAAYVRQQEEILSNRILCEHGSDIFTEDMNYKALQARTKETSVSEKTGRYKRKKRFGASLSKHAPARFLSVLERKLGYIGKTLNRVNTAQYRASQYDHVSDAYEKVSLSTRSKTIAGHLIQRDLYSAFLLMCAESPDKPDRDLCEVEFPAFIENHDICINELLKDSDNKLSSFGLKDFAAV